MECEKKKMLQKVYEFLEKIQDKLPKDLSLECSRIKMNMQNYGVGPKYLNIFEGDLELKSPQTQKEIPKKRESLEIVKTNSPFQSNSARSSTKEPPKCIQRPSNLNEDKPRIRGNKDGKLPTKENKLQHNRASSHPGIKISYSPNSDKQHICATAYNKSDQRSKLSHPEYTHISQTPLPQTPKLINRSSEDPPEASPKEYQFTEDNITLFLGPIAIDPKCFSSQFNTEVPYENTNVNQMTECPPIVPKKLHKVC